MAKAKFLEQRWAKKFAANLAKVMEQKGITQVELAKGSGLSQGTISKYLTGERSPKLYHVVNIAKTLGIFLEELYNF